MGRIIAAGIVAMLAVPLSILVNRVVPEPYMDEIFHIPQAQQYCRGNFRSWDPMITTPPGLYYLSLVYIGSLFPGTQLTMAMSSFYDLCSVAVLRSANVVLAVMCSIIIYDIVICLRPSLGERRATIYTVVLSTYPLHWFFTFLYYTDVASTTAVLSMYLACLKRYYWFSALLGALAIFIRQTNVIWMLFVACTGAIKYAEVLTRKDDEQAGGHVKSIKENDALVESKGMPVLSNLRKRKTADSVSTTGYSAHETIVCSSTHSSGFLDEFRDLLLKLWCLKWEIFVSFFPFAIVLAAFFAFVIWNGSIVLECCRCQSSWPHIEELRQLLLCDTGTMAWQSILNGAGAKDAHAVSLHFAQIMYFGLVSAAAMAPVHFSLDHTTTLCQSFRKNLLPGFFQLFTCLTAGLISVHFFSVAHPYLLADNRHYTFYIWRKVIKAHWSMKYLLVPLYIYSWLSIFSILGKTQKKLWILAFFLACAAVLVPAPLVEFRYYTIPFYFVILHSQVEDSTTWSLIWASYTAINAFTMTTFLFRPFEWSHEPGIQRFIW